MTDKWTTASAKTAIRATGCTVRVTDGEFRVVPPGGDELSAYYTDDAADAVGTARAIERRRRARIRLAWIEAESEIVEEALAASPDDAGLKARMIALFSAHDAALREAMA